MTQEQIDKLLCCMGAESDGPRPELIETHISWVLLSGNYVYKIKKPLTLHFLDFSTREKRRCFCERELMLNRRLTENIYLEVLPVKAKAGRLLIGHQSGETVDHAVCMRRMEEGRRMDLLVRAGGVNEADMRKLAEKIAVFHGRTDKIMEKDLLDIPGKFADLASEEEHLREHPGFCNAGIISRAIDISNDFMDKHRHRVAARLRAGFVRDCHGDLHTRNIFMLRVPQPFDCIEFNDDLRQTRYGAAPALDGTGTATCDCRRSLPSSNHDRCGSRPPAPGPPWRAFRVDETSAREYSPPTAAIVSHLGTQRQGYPGKRWRES